jgi:hypothetical protein
MLPAQARLLEGAEYRQAARLILSPLSELTQARPTAAQPEGR